MPPLPTWQPAWWSLLRASRRPRGRTSHDGPEEVPSPEPSAARRSTPRPSRSARHAASRGPKRGPLTGCPLVPGAHEGLDEDVRVPDGPQPTPRCPVTHPGSVVSPRARSAHRMDILAVLPGGGDGHACEHPGQMEAQESAPGFAPGIVRLEVGGAAGARCSTVRTAASLGSGTSAQPPGTEQLTTQGPSARTRSDPCLPRWAGAPRAVTWVLLRQRSVPPPHRWSGPRRSRCAEASRRPRRPWPVHRAARRRRCGGLRGIRGDSYDNALAETVNGLYKTKLINRGGPWRSTEQVELATSAWVHWWNTQRLHGACGDVPPAEFEARHQTVVVA